MANNALIRKRMDELQSQETAEKEWWDRRKATIQTDFMKELDEEHRSAMVSPTSTKSLASPTGTSSTTKTVSDDDAVIVESGGPKEQQGVCGKKKKKGKH